MEKREDSLWRESALGEEVDVKVGKCLRANHQEYKKIRHQIDVLMQRYPAVRALFESDDAVTLTAEEHEALNRYFCLESRSTEQFVLKKTARLLPITGTHRKPRPLFDIYAHII